ncbi:hypothetical protein H0H92_000201 [Tricholoma furcatifolium]|nr:hypothetical protein H0H92_000201 [Tricholoma furcatifolium]
MSHSPALPAAPRLKSSDLPELGEGDTDMSNNGAPQEEGLLTFGGEAAGLLAEGLDFQDSFEVDRPLVDVIVPISELRQEYSTPDCEYFVAQFKWLESRGYNYVRRTKGDGDCFYRAFAFSFIERLLHATDKERAVARALKSLDSTLPTFEQAGFHPIAFNDGYDRLKNIIQKIDAELSLTEADLLQAAQILHNEEYTPYLTDQDNPNSEIAMNPREFCDRFVKPIGKEADHVQISALCRAFNSNVDVAYVDGKPSPEGVRVESMRFGSDSEQPIELLYRPGHFDMLVSPLYGA